MIDLLSGKNISEKSDDNSADSKTDSLRTPSMDLLDELDKMEQELSRSKQVTKKALKHIIPDTDSASEGNEKMAKSSNTKTKKKQKKEEKTEEIIPEDYEDYESKEPVYLPDPREADELALRSDKKYASSGNGYRSLQEILDDLYGKCQDKTDSEKELELGIKLNRVEQGRESNDLIVEIENIEGLFNTPETLMDV
jgi:hypothetical protein